jgi:hypothetical protein
MDLHGKVVQCHRFFIDPYKKLKLNSVACAPCGGGIEYLHRDPASRRRRRKGKSQI